MPTLMHHRTQGVMRGEPTAKLLNWGVPLPYLVLAGVLILAIALTIQYWYVVLPIALLVWAVVTAPRLIRHIRKNRYFSSAEFMARKEAIAAVVAEHNAIVGYANEMRTRGSFSIGASSTGSQAHLATFENTSRHSYRRDRNVARYGESNVHNCSLQVVRNAAADPLKYVMKYFGIKPTEDTLGAVERLGDGIARLENAVANLQRRENQIVGSFEPPPFILRYYKDEFMSHVGVNLPEVRIPYPEYRFEYVSAGGNSSQQTSVTLNTPTIDALIETLSQKIKFSKSAAGQRALMTAKLREFIKRRDDYTCRSCSVSVAAEPNLLLEVDHIVPVSRGGLSEVGNLQTLCWRCNRRKSNKLLAT